MLTKHIKQTYNVSSNLKSKLDAQIYGPSESAITREIIESQITYSTVEEAIKEKTLFMLDYHDLYLPYVSKVTEIKGTTLYGSRTLFFLLNSEVILKPLAIELTRPPIDGKPVATMEASLQT
ncbi:linoleate 13S-lipoxygenase 2-1, chloroplastic [Trifolium repens]|nr:linoleate 13S-lipoxygenase 2-1, chloroplastic [Trifolium repens]